MSMKSGITKYFGERSNIHFRLALTMGGTPRHHPLTGCRRLLPLHQGSSYSRGGVALGWGGIKDLLDDNGDLYGDNDWPLTSRNNKLG